MIPSDLQGAYHLPVAVPALATPPTVAIVDAYDNPNAESDLAAYRTKYGLPVCSSVPAGNSTPCFKKINQRGVSIVDGTGAPAGNTGWGQEIDLDIEMVSAVCPLCHITLVEADDNTFANLGAAVDAAVTSGANAVSNSWGGSEFSRETSTTYNGHFNHQHVAITASTGDSGYGVEFPAASQYVTAVGGTTLYLDPTSRARTSEVAWSGAGSGCSAYVPRPSWQKNVGTCGNRRLADVSAVADPATGVNVYDSYGSTASGNWFVFGGTSVASPIIASVYAMAGNTYSISNGSFPYTHTASLNDVTSGSNGVCTSKRSGTGNAPLCTAGGGWDGPTGLGTPIGTGAF